MITAEGQSITYVWLNIVFYGVLWEGIPAFGETTIDMNKHPDVDFDDRETVLDLIKSQQPDYQEIEDYQARLHRQEVIYDCDGWDSIVRNKTDDFAYFQDEEVLKQCEELMVFS